MNIAISTASFSRAFRENKLDILDFPEVCDRAGLGGGSGSVASPHLTTRAAEAHAVQSRAVTHGVARSCGRDAAP